MCTIMTNKTTYTFIMQLQLSSGTFLVTVNSVSSLPNTYPFHQVFHWPITATHPPNIIKSHYAMFHTQENISFVNSGTETAYVSCEPITMTGKSLPPASVGWGKVIVCLLVCPHLGWGGGGQVHTDGRGYPSRYPFPIKGRYLFPLARSGLGGGGGTPR